ncbi:hypothetical protein GC105_04585 [Alkalibaculum sp. M08DMB]|uniref:GNAT family N-acetyltransferase n=1 Tax=Alkalibaculum sporogenes TaxID=2655001 RepID=A0A6A7K7I8_9FIRM|nr:GNAT family N-acetyltransferase [Alkalibaculum sporogenes]MPW25063.1 hypothetical protein [Alkalibaculum sporogenes]
MKLLKNLKKQELNDISEIIGSSFLSNELFHEFGSIEERKDIVMKYMWAYVKCVYESNALYQNDDGTAYIGLTYSDRKAMGPQLKMLIKILRVVPFSTLKRFFNHIKQISDGNSKYTKNTYVEVLMVCVSEAHQGQGKIREMIEFAMDMARERNVPLLFDTDMEEYAKIYQHFGCELYNTNTASNGVTRYNLVWKES